MLSPKQQLIQEMYEKLEKKHMKTKEIHRIPYNNRRYSQLSVARHYWWIEINWKRYVFDTEEMKKLEDWTADEVFPDLVCYE